MRSLFLALLLSSLALADTNVVDRESETMSADIRSGATPIESMQSSIKRTNVGPPLDTSERDQLHGVRKKILVQEVERYLKGRPLAVYVFEEFSSSIDGGDNDVLVLLDAIRTPIFDYIAADWRGNVTALANCLNLEARYEHAIRRWGIESPLRYGSTKDEQASVFSAYLQSSRFLGFELSHERMARVESVVGLTLPAILEVYSQELEHQYDPLLKNFYHSRISTILKERPALQAELAPMGGWSSAIGAYFSDDAKFRCRVAVGNAAQRVRNEKRFHWYRFWRFH